MIDLNEAWKQAYLQYLDEEEAKMDEDFSSLFEELHAAQESTEKSLDILKEYYCLYGLQEGTLTEAEAGDYAEYRIIDGNRDNNRRQGDDQRRSANNNDRQPAQQNAQKPQSSASGTSGSAATNATSSKPSNSATNVSIVNKSGFDNDDFKNLTDVFAKQIRDLYGASGILNQDNDKNDGVYKVEQRYTLQSISDMKFPKNIIFFIQQLIRWIKDVVIYFIQKFLNIIRKMTGREVKDIQFPKLDLNKMVPAASHSDLTVTGRGKIYDLSKDSGGKQLVNGPVKDFYLMNSDDLEKIQLSEEGFADKILGPKKKLPKDEDNGKDKQKPAIVVRLDFTDDIANLKAYMAHFFDLYDNAYGSNNERLFSTDDLETVLKIFKNAIDDMKNGETPVKYALNGTAQEVSPISAGRIKQNLILTNANIRNLKQAYIQTTNKITDISRIINSKEMMALSDYGVTYKALTDATLAQLNAIMEELPRRFRDAKKLEKDLQKMQKSYEKVIDELNKMQHFMLHVSNITYDSIYNRKISELLDAARYMSDIVTLRLSGLGLYLQELRQVRDALLMLSGINGGPKRYFLSRM